METVHTFLLYFFAGWGFVDFVSNWIDRYRKP